MYKDLNYTRSLKEYNFANTRKSMKIFLQKRKSYNKANKEKNLYDQMNMSSVKFHNLIR